MAKTELPEHTLRIIRQRIGLEEYDKSRDDYIQNRPKFDNVRSLVGWELGTEAWADQFLYWMRDAGMDMSSLKKDLGSIMEHL